MPSVSFSYGSKRFTCPRLNFETFQNLDADPADTIRTVTDPADALRIERIDGPSVASAESVSVCVTGA